MIRQLLGCVLGLLLSTSAMGQGPVSDRQLLADRDFGLGTSLSQYRRPGNSAQVMAVRRTGWLARYNPVSLALAGAMLGYQRLMSQQLARSCPYQLTCSNFSKQAIAEFGTVKGIFLSADRIMRCNRIGLLDVSSVDVDPTNGLVIDSLSRYRR